MSNVKPGDLARFVKGVVPPEFEGVQCLVLRRYPCDTVERQMGLRSITQAFGLGEIWEVELLQPIRVTGRYLFVEPNHFKAGDKVGAHDNFLRRIDPPADTQELYRDQPTDQELADTLNAKIKEAFNG